MYSIKVEVDPTCTMSKPFMGISCKPYRFSIYREDHSVFLEFVTASLENKYQKLASQSIMPEFHYLAENVEIEEAMRIADEFRCLMRKKCQI